MADYADSIPISEFKYSGNVYFTNSSSEFKSTFVAKLILDASNFNFNLANSDGSDFFLVDGVSVFRQWCPTWSVSNQLATIFFKLQNVPANTTVTYKAYWGHDTVTNSQEPESMGFLFYEGFDSSPLDSSKWTGSLTAIYSYGYEASYGNNITTVSGPMSGHKNWVTEFGVYADWSNSGNFNSSDRSFAVAYEGTENDFRVEFFHVDKINTNAVVAGGGTETTFTETEGALEGYSVNDVYVSYYEPDDEITVKLFNRNTYQDVTYTINRKVEGDTRPTNIGFRERETHAYSTDGAAPSYISWLVVREYDVDNLGSLDGSELFIEYENVSHQANDGLEYGDDLTSILYEHESDFGGNPYNLSTETMDSNDTVWVTDSNATNEAYVTATIHLAWGPDQLVSRSLRHYDSGHVYYYNASKLSDLDEDRMGRNYWYGTTTSGWAAVRFNEPHNIGALRIQYNTDYGAGPKDFVFYGSNQYPQDLSGAYEITSGSFEVSGAWQSKKIPGSEKYKYFILDAPTTQSGLNIKLQEWRMYDSLGNNVKKYPAQLRLHPALYGDYETNFPKEIQLEGTPDGVNWYVLLQWTNTYTPFVQHQVEQGYWQYYSFDNIIGVWSLRLKCRDNWGGSDGKIIIGGWDIRELKSEEDTYRILAGGSNNIQQIWATTGTTFDDENRRIFVANDKLNVISNNKLKSSQNLPSPYIDFNVV